MVVAVTMLSIYLYDRAQANPRTHPVSAVKDWETHNEAGIPLGGSADAPLVVTEFMDFTCPYCRRMAPVIDSLLSAYPEQVRIVFHHFPLRGHELAVPSAIAAECAREQGRFREMYRSLWANQDSMGSWDWARFAVDAGIPDLDTYESCVSGPESGFPRIAAGRRIGEETGVAGTPTVWLNGVFVTARTVAEFEEFARRQGVELLR
jgi:protein-disulfide isomerase